MLSALVKSLLPFENPIGFGASDFIELLLTAILVFLALIGPAMERILRVSANRATLCMVFLSLSPIALRLILLPHHPAPSPDNYREFGHLLVSDTLGHFRLANPPHPFPQFFETFGVLQTPSYSSIDALGQGMALAMGQACGHPWAGVLLSVGAFCALCYWMLRAWTSPGWALVGGLFAVFEFGPLNEWTNGYAGGAVPAAAACLVFGSLPRLQANGRRRDALFVGVGISMCFLTRPYESIFLAAGVLLFLLWVLGQPDGRAKIASAVPVMLLTIIPALVLILFHDKAATGSWTTSPAALSRYEYGAPAPLTFRPDPLPHRELTREQQTFRRLQVSLRGATSEGAAGHFSESPASYFSRLEYRVRWYRFFFLAPMYVAIPVFLVTIRTFRDLWLILTLAMFALGVNFEADFEIASLAVLAPLLVLSSIEGLQRLSRLQIGGRTVGREAARLIALLCGVHFLFWYGVHLFETHGTAAAMVRYETWDSINHDSPARRVVIRRQIARIPGRQIVFVHYSPAHNFQDEWVFNGADIGTARTIWARDLGGPENRKLLDYYPDRSAWMLDPDESLPELSPYRTPPEPSLPDNSNAGVSSEPVSSKPGSPKTSSPKAKTRDSPFDPIP